MAAALLLVAAGLVLGVLVLIARQR